MLDASNGYALCLTHTHAFVWQYASTSPSPETFTFALPYPSKHTSDPLPLGALVSPGTSAEEPGLVVVMPVSGKISFWEHISSAATLDYFRQQRTGVEDTIPGMFSGEHVDQVTRADSAGFILSLSSGRLAHLSVRDGQGKPAISVQFLRSTWGQSSGVWDSVFGGIRNALKAAVQRGDLAAVRVDPSHRAGPRNVAAATKTGRLHAWRIQRGGHHEIISSVDAREAILLGLQQVLPSFNNNVDFEVVDFTFVPRGIDEKYTQASRLSDALYRDDDSIQHLLLLVSLSSKRQSQYALVEVEVQGEAFQVGMIRIISSYTTPVNPSATAKPRLYLPRPGLVAFLIFDRAVVIASVASPPETPDTQLQGENNALPATFEDVIDLRNEDSLEIVGTGLEEPQGPGQEPEVSRSHRPKAKNPTALLMIRGIGVVRIVLSEVDRFASEQPPEVTAKDKLEQAIFYGLKDDNPLVFEGRRSMPFSNDDIACAALELSDDILASRPVALAGGSASTDTNLRQRGVWLDKLISHLNAQKVTLDRRTKWQLLANAEKISMAREIWRLHETFLNERPKNERKTIVSEAIECINEEDKKIPDRSAGELDRARTWFIYDTGRLDVFLPWTYQVIKYYRKQQLADDATITRFLYEGMLVFYETLHGALEFRKRNLDLYGLSGEVIELGILAREEDYEGLPKPWTSTEFICEYFYRLIELCQMWLDTYYPPPTSSALDPVLVHSIRNMLSNLIDQLILTLTEYIKWAEGNGDQSADVDGTLFCEKCRTVLVRSSDLLLKLRDFDLWDEALKIAEKYHDNKALAELIVTELAELAEQMNTSDPRGAGQAKDRLVSKKQHLIECMDKYDASFAFEAYKMLLANGGPSKVLEFSPADRKGFGTMFLRNDQRLGKISWINDIENEKDLENAAKTLIDVGEQEDQVWSKKIELSLGKLTLLAESASGDPEQNFAESRSKAAKCDADLARVEKELEIIRIQDRTYQMLFPAFQDAVDDVAAVELAMQAFAPKTPKKYKVLHDDLEDAMSHLVAHKAMAPLTLINLLTLVRLDDIVGTETDLFCSAIRVADLALHGEQKQQAMRLIWRRCYIRDDWSKVNHTENMNDQAVLDILGQTQAYCTMVACIRWRMEASSSLVSDPTNLPCVDMSTADNEYSYILTPDDAQGVFTNPAEERFGKESDDPALVEKRAEAMRWEDVALKKFIDKNQLARWAAAAYEAADRTVRFHKAGAADANGANGSLVNGNGTANGHVVQSVEQDDDEMDGEIDEIA